MSNFFRHRYWIVYLAMIGGIYVWSALWQMSDDEAQHQMSRMIRGNSAVINPVKIFQAYRLSYYLHQRYPLESLESRLADELPVDQRNLSQVYVSESEDPPFVFVDLYPRRYALRLLHESNVIDFMLAPDNGLRRVPKPGVIDSQFVRLADLEDESDGIFANECRPSGELIELPFDDAELKWQPKHFRSEVKTGRAIDREVWISGIATRNPFLLPSRSFMASAHRFAVTQFGREASLGFFRTTKKVAGFVPHHVSVTPDIGAYFAPEHPDYFANTEKLTDKTVSNLPSATWKLARMELVSLLKSNSPVVYESSKLPNMGELNDAPVRPLDEFEEISLPSLWNGETVMIESRMNRIKMLGAIRARDKCHSCHASREGELLGAFSYQYVRLAENR